MSLTAGRRQMSHPPCQPFLCSAPCFPILDLALPLGFCLSPYFNPGPVFSPQVLEQSVRANGLDGETWYQLGLARQAAGDLEGAEKALAQGLRLGEAGALKVTRVD